MNEGSFFWREYWRWHNCPSSLTMKVQLGNVESEKVSKEAYETIADKFRTYLSDTADDRVAGTGKAVESDLIDE